MARGFASFPDKESYDDKSTSIIILEESAVSFNSIQFAVKHNKIDQRIKAR